MALTAKVKKTINTSLRIVIAFLASWFIYKQLADPQNFLSFTDSFQSKWNHADFMFLIIVSLLLMPVNWGVEAFKWKLLINYAERVSFKQALMSVFSGITMSLFTPNRVGEFLGRLLTLKHTHPLKGAFLTITGSISQLMTTLLFGMMALCFFFPIYYDLDITRYLVMYLFILITVFLAGGFMVMIYLKVSRVARLTSSFVKPGWEKIRGYLRVMRRLKRSLLIKVLMLSMFRYMIFSTQFYILLIAFGLSIPWYHAFILISMTYFTMTAIPTIALVDLGIRGSVSIYFLGLYFTGQPGSAVSILAASTAVWIINLAIPSLVGVLFINRMKLIREV